MKTFIGIIAVVLLIWLGTILFRSNSKTEVVINNPSTNGTTNDQSAGIVGCYAAESAGNIYTLNITSVDGQNVMGNLSLKNGGKDSSSGTFQGTYSGGILLADYTFQSEGTTSVMQIIFKRSGNDFIRGYGDVNGDGTKFTDINTITYDSTSPFGVFKGGECK